MKKLLITILLLGLAGCSLQPPLGADKKTDKDVIREKFNKSNIKDKYTLEGTKLKRVVKDNSRDRIEVIIGKNTELLGAGGDEFIPDLTITRWDEVSLTLHPKMIDSVAVKDRDLRFIDKKIVFDTPKIEYNLYDIPISEVNPKGAFEYEVILKEKPDTNIVEFDIDNNGLDFYYQPELTQEEIDNGVERPDNVIGSYAVYASENKTNYTGGKDYKVGKVGQIYRPKIIDSIGTEVWGVLYIENRILSVTIPQDFLDNAVYPVRHAAGLTFGYESEGGSKTGNTTDSIRCYYDAVAADGTVTSITWYNDLGTYDDGPLKLGLYLRDAAAGNHSYLASTNAISSPATDDWVTENISTGSGSVTNGTDYLLCIFDEEESIAFDTGDNRAYYVSTSYPAAWPNPLIDNTLAASMYSIYATYTPSGGGGAVPTNQQDVFWYK